MRRIRVLDAAVLLAIACTEPPATPPAGREAAAHVATADVETTPVRAAAVRLLSGTLSLVAGDTAQRLQVAAYDQAGRRIERFVATALVLDTTVAMLDGERIRPRAPGGTIVEVRVGGQSAAVGVHVYERVATLDALRPEQRYVLVPLRLTSGEVRRWSIPPGQWMFTMLPEGDTLAGPRLAIVGAQCRPSGLSARRFICFARERASVAVYGPWRAAGDTTLTGALAVRRLDAAPTPRVVRRRLVDL
jgi:hypothetical protein